MNMDEGTFWRTTLHSFNLRLKGWQEAREAERLEQWRQTRTVAQWLIATTEWKKAPDIMELMPLPGDPPRQPKLIEISDEEMARRKYRAKKAHGLTFNDEFEALVRQHWQPDWGPHPDELTPPKKTAASPT